MIQSKSSLDQEVCEFVKRFVAEFAANQGTQCKFFTTLPPGFYFSYLDRWWDYCFIIPLRHDVLTVSQQRYMKYKQGSKISGLRDNPVTQQDALPSSKGSHRDICPGRTRCLCRDIFFVILSKQTIKADA
ncbi:hypothetical protein V6N13_037464 [Hibiscus sabdariffa]